MANLNKCFLIGRLARDVELRHTPKGTAVTEIDLAISRVWTDENGQRQEESVFISVTLWGRQAEIAGQYLVKGRSVFIEGRLHLDTWDDKQTGQKRSRLKIIGENLQLLGERPPTAEGRPPPPRPSAAELAAARRPSGSPARSTQASDPDEEIPF